jgi:SAM-dependent methyltransferase
VEETDQPATAGDDYTQRLQRLEGARWKQVLNTQAPYRWNVRRLELGRTLDVGCGIGRNLAHLGGNGVGVDHNPTSIAAARSRGLEAYTVEEFFASPVSQPESFDSLLAAHVLEHMPAADGQKVIGEYLPCLRPGGRVVFITPQEKGYTTDATHVRFVDFEKAYELGEALGLTRERHYSFPFPRAAGKAFPYNEFVTILRKA